MKKIDYKSKIILLAFCLAFFFSTIISLKFDKTSFSKSNIPYNELVKGDSAHYFLKAELFKKNLNSGKIFDLADEYQASLLYPVSLGLFYNVFNEELFYSQKINNNKVVNNTKIKILFLILQSIIYFLSVIFLAKKMENIFSQKIIFITTLYLIFEPTIFQFLALFMTEILYLSFLNFLIGILILPPKNIFKNISLGFFIGISYLLKTVSILLVVPISIYYVLVFKKKSFFPIMSLILGYILVIVVLGYSNYQRSGIFYTSPTQSMDAPYWYMAHKIQAISKNTSEETSYKIKISDEKKWIKENKINLDLEKDRILLAKYKQKYANQIFIENPFILTKYIVWKSLQFLIFDPTHLYKYIKINYVDKDYQKIPENKTLLKINIVYSLFIYLILLLGFINSFRIYNIKFILLISSLVIYYILLLGWTGGSRYNLPIMCLSSIFFSSGFYYIKNIFFSKFRN